MPFIVESLQKLQAFQYVLNVLNHLKVDALFLFDLEMCRQLMVASVLSCVLLAMKLHLDNLGRASLVV